MYANSTVKVSKSYRISWGAVFAGVIMGLAVQILLGSLGVAIGASTVDPTQEANPLAGLGTGAAIWLFVSTLVAYYFSGWIAGRMAGVPAKSDGALHGLLTWGVSTVLTLVLLTGAIGGAVSGIGKMLGGAARAGQNSGMSSGIGGAITNELQRRGLDVNGIQSGNPDQIRQQANNAAGQIQNQVQNPQVQAQARQAGETAAKGTAMAGYGGFLLLALSAALACFGGSGGANRLNRVYIS